MANKAATGVGLVDRSIASLGGSSQKLMSQNLQRGALMIQNVGNANVGFAFAAVTSDGTDGSATAAIGSSGTYTLAPNGSFVADAGFIPLGAIYVIGTSGQPVTASESV